MADAWFKEKYDPILGPTTRMKLVEYRKWLYLKFMQDLDAGKFDELTLDGAAGMSNDMNLVNNSTTVLCREEWCCRKSSEKRR